MKALYLDMKWLKAIGLVCTLLFLQACQGDTSDLEAFVRDAYKDKKPRIEPLPEIQPYQGYTYAANEENDPFSFANIAGRDTVVSTGKRPDEQRRREPLEEYPLDSLRFVGTMSQEEVPWVIVQTSRGTAHRATLGNYMGQNDGKIKQIRIEEQLVVLVETVLDPAGRWVTRDVEISIDE